MVWPGCASVIWVLEEGHEEAGKEEEGMQWRNIWDYMREPPDYPLPEKSPDVVDDILLCKTDIDSYAPLSLSASTNNSTKQELTPFSSSPASETGRPRLTVIRKGAETGPLSKEMLDPSAAVIMDASTYGEETCALLSHKAQPSGRSCRELFVWIGRDSSLLQRQIAKAAAVRFRDQVNQEARPSWAPLNIIYQVRACVHARPLPCPRKAEKVNRASLQGHEPATFIAKFPDWCAELFAPLPSNYATAQMARHRIAPTEPIPKLSIGTCPCLQAELRCPELNGGDCFVPSDQVVGLAKPPPEPLVDEGGGSVEVWVIEDGKPTFTKIPHEERGHFYSGGASSPSFRPLASCC